MPLIYIGYPVDQARAGRVAGVKKQLEVLAVETWKRNVRTALLQAGMAVYEPGIGFSVPAGAEVNGDLEEVNGAALEACDAVVAVLPADVATIGTVVEITRAVDAGKPVVIVTDLMDRSHTVAQFAERPNVRIVEYRADQEQRGLAWPEQAEQAAGWIRAKLEGRGPKARGGARALRFQQLAVTATLPTRGYADDAGMDLYVSEAVVVGAGMFQDVATGVAVDLPDGYWARITGRSSTWRKLGLQVIEGVIDTGYTGPLFCGVYNPGSTEVLLEVGQRVAQLLLHRCEPLVPTWGVVAEKARGQNGFGSTG